MPDWVRHPFARGGRINPATSPATTAAAERIRYLGAGLAPDPADPIYRPPPGWVALGYPRAADAARTMQQFSEAMANLRRTLTRPALCFDFDRMGLDFMATTWDFPTWAVRRRPFDWSTDA